MIVDDESTYETVNVIRSYADMRIVIICSDHYFIG